MFPSFFFFFASQDAPDEEDNEQEMQSPFLFHQIGVLRSPLCKNGSPRQGVLVGNVRGILKVSSGVGNNEEHALEGLEGFSHVWLIFVFHKNRGKEFVRNKVRPPKIEGKKGLFATRTPHRPNPIGLTLCKLDRVEGCTLFVSQHDLIDGTPVLDVKPYLNCFDSIPNSVTPPWVPKPEARPEFELLWSDESVVQLKQVKLKFYDIATEMELFQRTVTDLLALNPRSKYW